MTVRGPNTGAARRGLWLASAAAACLLMATPSAAQEQRDFNVPAQDASQAVRALARQGGVQVMAAESDLEGVTTRPVRGRYGALEAIERMISGTGLEAVATGPGTITIRRRAQAPGQAAPPPAAATEVDEVVVTGSRLQRAGFDTLQAALVTDSEEIDRRGYTNIGEALRDTPGFAAPDSSPVGAEPATLGVSQTFVDFFGLGSQRTLTLVNGRRFVSSNTVSGSGGPASPGSQVDLNTIPAGLVDRVETVAIGGAPVYGSDAIAGTVNVILKDDFEGAEATVQYGITDRNDAESHTFRGLIGANSADGRGNAVLALEYNEQAGLRLSDRMPFSYRIANSDNTGPNDGIPSHIVVRDARFAVLTEGGLPYDNQLEPLIGFDLPGIVFPPFYTANNYIYDSAGNPLQFGPDGELVPYVAGVVVQEALGAPVLTEGGDGVNPADHFGLLTPSERTLFNANARYDLTPSLRVFVEGSYAHTEGTEQSELYQYAAPAALGGPTLRFDVDNPFLSAAARNTILANGLTDFTLNRNLNDIVDRDPGQTTLDLARFVGGLEGGFDVAGDWWRWDLSYNHGRSESRSEQTFIDPDRLLLAIDAVIGGSGEIVCASGGDCVPINLFGADNFSDAAAAWVTDRGSAVSINTQQVVTANLAGELPFGVAGPIAFNVGAEWRKETGSFEPDVLMQAGNQIVGGANAFEGVEGEFTTKEVYAEVAVPLISEDRNFPLIKDLTFEGAVRHVDNSLTGGDLTWSAGGRLAPRLPSWGDGLILRGVFTHAIRSPAITELFLGTAPVSSTITDVCNAQNYNQGANPAVREANCRAALAAVGVSDPAAFNSTTGVVSAFGSRSGNPDLQNEVADSWSVGLVFQPTALPGFRASLDWSAISLEDGIQTLGIGALLAACYDSSNFPNEPACAAFERLDAADAAAQPGPIRNAGDIANGFRTGFYNTSTLEFAGLIAAAEYRFDIAEHLPRAGVPGAMRLSAKMFYTDTYESRAQPGAPLIDSVGEISVPEFRGNFAVGYVNGPLDLDLQAIWTSAVVVDNLATIENLPADLLGIDDYWRFNGAIGYRINERVRAQLAVSNLFDAEVPFPARAFRSFGAYDPIGRTYLLRLTAAF